MRSWDSSSQRKPVLILRYFSLLMLFSFAYIPCLKKCNRINFTYFLLSSIFMTVQCALYTCTLKSEIVHNNLIIFRQLHCSMCWVWRPPRRDSKRLGILSFWESYSGDFFRGVYYSEYYGLWGGGCPKGKYLWLKHLYTHLSWIWSLIIAGANVSLKMLFSKFIWIVIQSKGKY